MEFKKTYRLTASDYFRFNLFYAKKRIAILYSAMFVLLSGFILLNLSAFSATPSTLIYYILGTLVCVLFLIGILIGVNLLMIRSVCIKQYRSSKAMQAEYETVISDEGVLYTTVHEASLIPWNDLFMVRESKHGIYFFESRLLGIILPKALLTDAECRAIRQLCVDYLEAAKNKLKKP
jgi:hypothetical protein